MPATPRIRLDTPMERGQSTITGTLNGGLSIQRPLPRPGPIPKASGQANTVLGRRLIGGQNEKQVVELFATFATVRLGQSEDGEPGDIDIANRRLVQEQDDEETDYVPSRRYAYSREQKLAAIDYFQTTWKQKLDDTYERMSNRYASCRLRITRKQLRDWVANKERIMIQKRGSFCRKQNRVSTIQEPQLEYLLNKRFEKAREQGRKISFKWMM